MMKMILKKYSAAGATLLFSISLIGCQAPLSQDVALEPTDSVVDEVSMQPEITDSMAQAPVPEMVVAPIVKQRVITLGSSNELIGSNAETELQEVFEELAEWTSVTGIRVVGHTDSEGSEASNQKLSIKRAQAIAEKLIEFGVAQELFELEGKGEMQPIGDNSTTAGRAVNRRVEIEVEGTHTLPDVSNNHQWVNSEL